MLRVNRPDLPAALRSALDHWQQAVNNGETNSDPWQQFHEQDKETKNAILALLKTLFHSKCAYCETPDADELDHFWPKSPHHQNGFRGTPHYMFAWDNLLLACHKCNGFSCKGSRMAWDGENPRLLNPCVDEPLHYFALNLSYDSDVTAGHVAPRQDLSPTKQVRAEYTLRLLKLNERRLLVEGRLTTLRQFLDWVEMLARFGPEFKLPSGYTIRQRFLDMLDCHKPFLAPIRQILHENPDLYTALLAKIPELADVIVVWHLPVADTDG
ncbi:MAG: TIGR02646 family protein [Caldilinea sp. CFX5]|nr:TIGR02646 family protein [Caldilinea sp. CFX5]